MKTKIILLTVSILLCFSQIGKAQNTMQVNKQDGSKDNTFINDVRKLTFPEGNLLITKKNGSTVTFVLSDVNYINFLSISTSVSSVFGKNVQALQLYPNPVVNELKLNLRETNTKSVVVSVTNSSGIILFTQTVENNQTIGINVSTLPKGVYFCIVKTDGKTSVGKFIK